MGRTIATRLAIEGENEYKRAIANVNDALKTHKSELAEVQSRYRENADGMEALKAKGEVLNKIYAEQNNKVKELEAALANAQKSQKSHAEAYAGYTAKLEAAKKQLENLRKSTTDTSREQDVLNKEIEEYERLQGEAQAKMEAATKGVNNWQRQLNYAKTDLAELEAQIEKNNQSLQQMSEKLDQAASKLNSAGNTLTAGLTVPLAAAGAAAFEYASDTEEAANKVEESFKEAADGVKQWSETTLTSIGLAKGTAQDMAALYGDLATSMGAGRTEAAEMSKTLVELGADLASFKNIGIDQTATALTAIFTGETEAMKRLGVVMTEVNLKQFAMAQGYTTAYEQMTQLEKVQLRYEYVLANTANAQGDFARTSDSAANQQRILTESLKEAAATAGEDLLPVITPIIAEMGEMVQGFADLDEETRKTIVQTGLFLATLGPMLKLTGGVTSAVSAAAKAYGALKTAQAAAAAGQVVVNTAMKANAIVGVVTAVGALVAVLTSYALSAKATSSANQELLDSLKESKTAWEEQKTELEQQRDDLMGTVAAVEQLAAVENKSVSQKQALLAMVDELNEKVPGLSLAYNEQTDSLNLTAAAMRELAMAEAERAMQAETIQRMSDLYVQQAEIERELQQAQKDLAIAQSDYNEKAKELGPLTEKNAGQYKAVSEQLAACNNAVLGLTQAQEENEAELAELEAQYGAYSESAAEAEAQTSRLAAASTVTAADLKELSEKAEVLMKQTKELAGAEDTLSAALKEQQESGSLALDTALSLIDAGYEAALVTDQETGAITVNKEAYIQLAQAKITQQIESLKAQKASVDAKLTYFAEADAVRELSGALYDNALAILKKRAAEDDNASALMGQSSAYQAQIKALEAAKKSLGSYTGAAGAAARSSAAASKEAQTQAAKDLEAFKKQKEDLDHLKTMDAIDEQEYYDRLKEIRDQYLADDDNVGEYRRITEQLYQYDKQLAEDQEKLWQQQSQEIVSEWKEKLQGIADEYEQQMQEIQKKIDAVKAEQEAMTQKLSGYGDLFNVDNGKMELGDLEGQLKVMERYYDTLSGLRDRGISDSLLDEVSGMGVDDAIAYGEKLLKMSQGQWDEYNALWEEKQKKAKEIAEQFYRDELDALNAEYGDKLQESIDALKTASYDGFAEVIQSAIDGVESKKSELLQEFQSLASEIAQNTFGKYQTSVEAANTYVSGAMPRQIDMPAETQTANMGQMLAAAVNAIGVNAPAVGGTYRVEIPVEIDGKEFYRITLDDLRQVERANPEVE